MLVCANCGKTLKECCDLYYEATDTQTGEDVVLCGECAAKVEQEANAREKLGSSEGSE